MYHIYRNSWKSIWVRNCCSSSEKKNFVVTVIGAAGGVGQFLTYGLKFNKLIKQLRLYDIDKKLKGIAADVSHIDTSAKVKVYEGENSLRKSLICADVVAICGGQTQKPGMKSEDLFAKNAKFIQNVVSEIGYAAPFAITVIVTTPVNMLVPMAALYLNQENAFNSNRLFGVTKLNEIRAKTLIGKHLKIPPPCVKIPVIGGHSTATILPVLSKSDPNIESKDEEAKKLVESIRNAGDNLLKTKGTGSATLSAGWASTRFISSILKAMSGKKGIVETAYVQSQITDASFFSSNIVLGKCGIEEICPLPDLNETEKAMLKNVVSALKKDIAKGCEYANKNPAPSKFCTLNKKKDGKDNKSKKAACDKKSGPTKSGKKK